MNKYQIEHIERMLTPLSNEIELLSAKFKKLDHDFNNLKMVVGGNRDLTKMNLRELTNKINLITKKEK